MAEASPFAQVVVSQEALISQVTQRVLQGGHSNGTAPQQVEALATTAVQELWAAPVKTFILVIAARQVQDALQDHDAR